MNFRGVSVAWMVSLLERKMDLLDVTGEFLRALVPEDRKLTLEGGVNYFRISAYGKLKVFIERREESERVTLLVWTPQGSERFVRPSEAASRFMALVREFEQQKKEQ